MSEALHQGEAPRQPNGRRPAGPAQDVHVISFEEPIVDDVVALAQRRTVNLKSFIDTLNRDGYRVVALAESPRSPFSSNKGRTLVVYTLVCEPVPGGA